MDKKAVRTIHILICVVMAVALLFQAVPVQSAESVKDFGDFVITVYNERNGLPTGEANTVIQTSEGYIWVGSYGGLIRYDGTRFRNYSEEENGISSSSVRTLFEDSRGRLWIGTNDAGIYVYENGEFSKIKNQDEHTFLCIRDFAEGKEGEIYAASNSGLARITDDRLIPLTDESLDDNTVYSMGIDKYGRVWCSMNQGICMVVEHGQVLEQLSSDLFFDGEEIYCASSGKEGEIYLGSSKSEFVRVDLLNEGFEASSFKLTSYQTGNVNTHNQIRICEDGTILVSGLRGFGVVRPDGEFLEFDENKKASSVNSAAMDYEGNIWLASSAFGVVKYSKGCFETPNERAKLTDKALNTVVKADDSFYAGADDCLMAFDRDWRPLTNPLTNLLSEDRVRHLIVGKDGTIWAATYYGHGVVSYRPDTEEMKCYGLEEGLVSMGARVLLERSDGSIAVGTQDGISIIKNGAVEKSYKKDEKGLTNATVLCLAEDEKGILYAGTDGGGIFAIDGEKITCYGFSEGLGEGVVLRMLEDKAGEGWFVSAGSSLYYLEKGSFRKLDNFEKSAGSIFDLYERDGDIYMLQNSGILKADRSSLLGTGTVQTVQYGFFHGLTGSLNANTWNYIDEEGILYLSTRSGISCFAFSNQRDITPQGIIGELKADGRVYVNPGGQDICLKKDDTRITIDFSTLSYTGTTASGMTCWLEGFDETKTEIRNEKSSSISYTNLPGGDYTFRLRVYLISDPESGYDYFIHIHKDKKLTEYPLFWILAVVIAAALVLGICILIACAKIAAVRKRQEEYQTIVDQFLRAFAKTIDAKDKYTNGHSIRVAYYSRELAKRLGMSAQDQERVYYIALMHDIGKIGIPDSILKKAGKLTKEEMDIIKTHPEIGGEILKDCTALDGISEGARYHHERFDGTGYCEGLNGQEIPMIARIIGVADAYDAMSNARCYRKALDQAVIEEELKKGAGSQFDPDIVPVMLQMMEEGSVPVDLDGNSVVNAREI